MHEKKTEEMKMDEKKEPRKNFAARGSRWPWMLLGSGLAVLMLFPVLAWSQRGGGWGGGRGMGPCGQGKGPGFGRGFGRGFGGGSGWGRKGSGFGGRGHGFGPRAGKLMFATKADMKTMLGLSDAQANKIVAARKATLNKMAALELKAKRNGAALKFAWLADSPDYAKLRKLHQYMVNLHTQMANARFDLGVEVSKVLTKEQRLKLMAGRGGRRWRRFRGGGRP